MAKWQVLTTDVWGFMLPCQYEKEQLESMDCELIFGRYRSTTELIQHAKYADILLNFELPLRRETIEQLPNCKLIVRYSIGVDDIDIKTATERGILVANTPTYCVEDVSDHAISLLLACARFLFFLDRDVRASRWAELWADGLPPYHARRINKCTVGLIGFGRIGQAMGRKCKALGMQVLAYDPYVNLEVGRRLGISLVGLSTVVRDADFVSVHVPLQPETRHIVNEELLLQMKPTAYLINTSRGGVIDEPALITALSERKIAGAGLDVFSKEPPDSDNPLFRLDNVILTPHFASVTIESTMDIRREAMKAVGAFCRGEWPDSVVNSQVQTKISLIHLQSP